MKPKIDYQRLSQELDELLEKLQSEDLDIDEAVACYQRGMKIVKQLEDHLTSAENTITKIKASAET